MSPSPGCAGRCMFSCGKVANPWMKRLPWPQEGRNRCLFAFLGNNTQECSTPHFLCFSCHCALHTLCPRATPHQPPCMLVSNAWDCRPAWSSSRHWGQGHQVAWVERWPLITHLRLFCHCRVHLWPVNVELVPVVVVVVRAVCRELLIQNYNRR